MNATKTALDTFLRRMHAALKDRLRTDAEALERVSTDASHEPAGRAAGLLLPQTTAEVSLIAREAAELGVPLVPRGAGTGKSGACIPHDEVVVDLSAMRAVLEMRHNDLYAVVQPGLITSQLDEAARAHGLMYPPDPSSWESCTLGGNIATNAGGARAVKYGVTARYVWSLEVVLAGGAVQRIGRHSIKGVAGLDLTALMVGSEGTLGFITEATLHIVPAPRGVQTAWLTFASPEAASDGAARIFKAGLLPRMLELLDGPALAAVRPQVGWPMPESGAAMLVETDAMDDQLAMDELARLCDVAQSDQSLVASSEREREAMRRSRRLVSPSLKALYPQKISDDIAVPRSAMPALLTFTQQVAREAGLDACAYGHMGDGNLHINILCKNADEHERAAPVRESLWRFAVGLRGTVSGEHGIGTSKVYALTLEQSQEAIDWQRRIKKALDPRGIMNPGKVFAL